MIHFDDLAQLAEDLQKLGVDACHDFLYGPYGIQEGLDIGEDFFPLWELNVPENQDAFERCDFAAIKARPGSNWSIAPSAWGAG